MKITRSLTGLAAPLLVCTLPLCLPAQETGFQEKFALAENRDDVLKELIPGTDDYYYWHALHLQNQGRQEDLTKLLGEWTARYEGENQRRREILNRQALISYAKDPAGSLAYLRERLGISYNHQRIRPEARPELSTKLDPATISWDAFLSAALNGTDAFGNVTGQGLVALVRSGKAELTVARRRDLLNRLHRADFPSLVQIIHEDLGTRESRGFGEFAIHGKLTLEQLEALLKLRPALLQNAAFVNAWAGKLRPAFGEDPVRDPAVREAWLERLESFADRLTPAFNSLKAHVLYHRLQHDYSRGTVNEARLLKYLQLPRPAGYIRPEWRETKAFELPVDLNADYSAVSGSPQIGNDEPLVRSLLLEVLAKADSAEKYAPWLHDAWLNALHAEARLVSGAADAEKWVSRLDPSAYQGLKDRIDLDFDPALREDWAPADEVSLDLHLKNVPRLLVKLYEINTENVHRTTGAQVNTDLDLDGLTANAEQVHEYKDAPLLRQKHSFTFPELKGKRGVWIIEFIGGGKSSRALIRKGGLRHLAQQTSAGTVLSVFDEAMQPVKKPFALLGGTRRFDALEDGSILIPFSTTPGAQSVIIGDGSGFTSLEQVTVAGENYTLKAGFHVARESLLPGMNAKLAIRPALLVNGMPVTTAPLEKLKLTIQSRTLDGVPASTVQELAALSGEEETIVEFAVPERLSDLSLTLEGQLKSLITGQPVQVIAADSVNVNGITLTEQTGDLHLTHADGQFSLEERGRTGEGRPDREVVVTFSRPEFSNTITQTFRTDERGFVSLGSLAGVAAIHTRTASGVTRTFPLPQARATLPPVVNVKTGEPVQLAWAGNSEPAPGDVSVLEMRGGSPVRDVSSAATVAGGLVTMRGLAAGEYAVELAPSGTSTLIRVAEGQTAGGHLLSRTLTMELSSPAPLAVTGMARAQAVNKDGTQRPVIVFRIGNAGEGTRVHVLASRFLPEFDVFDALAADHLPQPMTWTTAWRPSLYQNARIIGEEYRYVLDRKGAKQFPGNMLPRPGLLLNPWAISDTQTDRQSAQRGEDARPMAAEVPPAPAAAAADPTSAAKRKQDAAAAVSADLGFLSAAGGTAFNLKPDKDGNVMIDAAALGDRQFIRVMAVDSDSAVVRDFSLPAQQLVLQDLRLAGGLNPKEHYSRQNRVTLLEKDTPFVFKDALTATWESIGSLGAAHTLLFTLSKDSTLAEFAWLLNWPELKPEQRSELYSKYACHELSFFLAQKDPEFFRTVIRPYLANKRDKTFMDHYLLEVDLSAYLRPWEYSRLNTAERILLARRIEGERDASRRHIRDWLDMQPKDPVRDAMLFETALNGRTLITSGELHGTEWAGLVNSAGQIDAKAGRRMITIRPDMPKPLFAGTPLPNARYATGAANAPAGVAADKFTDLEAQDSLSVLDGAKLSEESAELDELKKQLSDAPRDESRGRGATREKAGKDISLRGLVEAKQERLFRQVEQTREWAENNYYRLLIAQQTAELVQPDRFWQDFALWDGKTPFVSANLAEAAGSFAEMMMALAVLDLPFPSQMEKGKIERNENSVTLTPGGRGILFHQEIRTAEVDKEGAPLLVSQNFYRHGDRYTEHAGEKTDKFVSGEFIAGVVYGCQVVVTNPSSSRQKLDLLFQIPEGSMPVLATQITKSQPVVLEPYHTGTYDFHFYFPAAGDFQHYPVHLSRNAKVAASAQPFTFHVVAKPTQADKASWEYVSQNAEPNEVLAFLEQSNVLTLNLDLMAWRLSDPDFAKRAIALLRGRHVWHATTWSYALQHNLPDAVTDYLMHSDAFLSQCGAWLDTPAVKIDPVARWWYQHLEYSPLVNARAHQLGAQRTILNDKLAAQYGSLVRTLSYRPQLDSEDHLAVTYYLALQDRIEEAISRFARVDAAKIAEKLQYDYLQAWLALSQEDLATARRIAAAHASHPVDKWKQKFAELASQLDEIDGKAPAKPAADDRDATQDRLAAQEPAVAVKIENRTVAVNFRNLTEVTVNYYPMDLEFLFSANPFVTQDTSRFRMIRPNRSEKIALPAGKDVHTFPLPAEYQSANVLVEVTGGGITRAEAAYANELDVQVSENFGQLQVRHAGDKRALSRVYVKVFADQNGTPVFYKDGYTDLRGKFDYASLSTGDLDGATRFSVLIMSEKHGATVRELQPPKR